MSLTLTSMQLRALAEWASGYRGEVVEFYDREGQIYLWRTSVDGPCPFPVLLACDTPIVVQGRPPVTVAQIGVAGDMPVDLLAIPWGGGMATADAVFWSESAVEKFLFPYYASKGSWLADLYTEALRTVFYGPRALEWYQRAQDDPGEFQDPSGISEDSLHDLENVLEDPFGLVHIPKSDYIPEEVDLPGGGALLPRLGTGGELCVLVRHRVTGKVRVRGLDEMVTERRRAAAARARTV